MKKAFITGITGQDGSYLAEFLLEKKYQVYGLTRRTSTQNYERIAGIVDNPNLTLVSGDLSDQHSLTHALKEIQPDEVYNLAAQSFVKASWDQPVLTGDFTGLGVTRMLEAVKLAVPHAKFYQASSSEMFGKVQAVPQTESTPFYPRSPYGVAKVYGHWITINYRESYDMFAISGILFNHESPRRGLEFVTRKIANAVARIVVGKQTHVELGNLDAQRDWGYAKDYVEAMWLMLQQENPEDYVIATGETHSVREFLQLSCAAAGISDWESVYKHNKQYDRPAEVDLLIGDPSKAHKNLGWKPSVTFEELVSLMVQAEIEKEQHTA
ncbi:MAG: GDP-mannose 4,6-dehydratase [Pseudomonadales bacterium]|nr:GDP-mannose 4,6-dehydratase [Candidatus Woesebacteria bacterium]MCB9802224.1 GDP-mannose 4,6-dehydratase [Pseudomonadales bacterium]